MANRLLLSARCFILLVVLPCTYGQNGPTFIGATYSVSNVSVAPGQIVRLQVTGLKPIAPLTSSMGRVYERAKSVPLPTTLAGISVSVIQYEQRFSGFPVTGLGSRNAPLLSVEQWNLCPGLFGTVPRPIPVDCITTFITVQIPTGISYTTAPFYIYSRIVISDNGVDSQPFGIDVIPDQKHILTECDISGPSSICPPIVTHADGTMVSTRSPAAPGEVVVIYGWGFGETTPPVETGEMAPAPAPVVRTLFTAVGFDFSPNAAPKSYIEGPSVPVTVYLTSGQVGLYQINVQLPLTFPAVRPCSRDGLFPSSNLTINVRGLWSFDGAPICVEATP